MGIVMPTIYRHKSHCVFACDYHIVISTKYRRKVIDDGIKAFILSRLEEIKNHYPDLILQNINTDKDHIHMLISIHPTISVGKVVGIIKANTARGMKATIPYLKKVYWGTDSIWSEGYFVSTVGIDGAIISNYVKKQGQIDSGQASLEL